MRHALSPLASLRSLPDWTEPATSDPAEWERLAREANPGAFGQLPFGLRDAVLPTRPARTGCDYCGRRTDSGRTDCPGCGAPYR